MLEIGLSGGESSAVVTPNGTSRKEKKKMHDNHRVHSFFSKPNKK